MTAVSPDGRVDNSLLALITQRVSGSDRMQNCWRVASSSESPLWIMVYNNQAAQCAQGWKLHVSATIVSAEAVLDRVLDVVLAETAEFKVASSLQRLAELNSGSEGFSQVGKFITVYPNDDQQAVRLASALHQATLELGGPAVPSDQQLFPDSLVSYRYGRFIDLQMQTQLGALVPAMSTPEGEHVPDLRSSFYQAPAWATDPFKNKVPAASPPNPLLNNRYVVLKMLYRSVGGTVAQALDVKTLRRCILKSARHDIHTQPDGRDARDMLRHEAMMLERLAPDPRFPQVFDLFEHEGDLVLAMEEKVGATLERYASSLRQRGWYLPMPQVVAWSRALADALIAMHDNGVVHGDLKCSNVIVTTETQLCVIDFDLACEKSQQIFYGQPARGYASPQRVAGAGPNVCDDVYSLGALMYSLVSGVDPALAPQPLALLSQPLALLNPHVTPAFAQIITRCLDPDPDHRFQSIGEVKQALASACSDSHALSISDVEALPSIQEQARHHAHQLGEALCAPAYSEQKQPPVSLHTNQKDLYNGTAGMVFAIALLSMACPSAQYTNALTAYVEQLQSARTIVGSPLPGLFFGEAGIGAALLQAGRALGDQRLIEVALVRGSLVGSFPHTSPDVLLGSAGRLRFHVLLWDVTAEHVHLNHALQAGEAILRAAQNAGAGGLRWVMPSGYEHLSGHAFCGYAHGAAGIGDALLDLFQASGDERFLAAAQGAAAWLTNQAIPTLDDDRGLSWPTVSPNQLMPSGASWFDGAAGIGRFFLHCAELDVVPGALDVAARAAEHVAHGARWAGPTQALGLAGQIEFLVDMFQATHSQRYLSHAVVLARLLRPWHGQLATDSDTLMLGHAGIALCWLRLSDPNGMPHAFSRRGLCYSIPW